MNRQPYGKHYFNWWVPRSRLLRFPLMILMLFVAYIPGGIWHGFVYGLGALKEWWQTFKQLMEKEENQ